MSTAGVPALRYGRAIRRRWPLIVVLTVLGMLAGYATAHPKAKASTIQLPSTKTSGYTATAILLPEASNGSITSTDPSGLSLPAIAYFATVGDVPRMVADELHYHGDPATLAREVDVSVNSTVGAVQISATQPTGAAAVRLVDAFDHQLIAYLDNVIQVNSTRQQRADRAELQALQTQLAKLRSSATTTTDQAAISAVTSEYQSTYSAYEQLLAAPTQTGLTVVQPPVAVPAATGTSGTSGSSGTSATAAASTTSSSKIPKGRAARTALGGLVGLLVGLALALLLDRFDDRLYERSEIEDAFGVPVIVELDSSGTEPVVASAPASASAERYRMLQAAVTVGGTTDGAAAVVLLASLRSAKASSLVAANLALAFGDGGDSVAAVAAGSDVHLRSLLAGPPAARRGGRGSRHWAATTGLSGSGTVSLTATNGAAPGARSSRAVGLVADARGAADVVLVDAGPVLTAHQAVSLAPLADAVVAVAVAGVDTAEQARRAMSLLGRSEARIVGVAVVRVGRAERRRLRHGAGDRVTRRHASGPASSAASPNGAAAPGGEVPQAAHAADDLQPPTN